MQRNESKDSGTSRSLPPKDIQISKPRWIPAWTGLADKTLWDILQFACTAAVPIVLAVWSTQQAERSKALEEQNRQQNQRLNDDNQHARIMSEYLDAMTKYLLEDSAKNPDKTIKADMLARARTLNTLSQLDPVRKGQLLKFLYEARLVGRCKIDATKGDAKDCQPKKLDLTDAKLDNVDFEKPIPLPGVDLTGALLQDARLTGIDLTGAQLQKASLTRADLSDAQMKNAQLKSSNLEQSIFKGASLVGANLENAYLARVDFSGSDLSKAKLNGSAIQDANLSNANLEQAEFKGVDLSGVSSLEGAKLVGAMYDAKTKFPKGFDFRAKGMRQK